MEEMQLIVSCVVFPVFLESTVQRNPDVAQQSHLWFPQARQKELKQDKVTFSYFHNVFPSIAADSGK